MRRILVLQNQRIGDTLQTTPLLVGLREKHRPCHITLVANRMFADLKLGSLVDEVIHFDQNGLFRIFSDPELSLARKYERAREFLEPFRLRHFDVVIDVPADTYMHLLASMLENAGELRGAVLSPARSWAYSHPEVMLLYTIGLCREVNRFNVVDLQNLLAGVRSSEKRLHLPIDRGAEDFAQRYLNSCGIDPKSDFVVALQPGASEERKRWGNSNFARLARFLVERTGAKIVLCGSSEEAHACEKICSEAGVPLNSATGRTEIAQLAALLQACHILVTNDTGTMHVAVAVGTPVIDISTGPVFFRETGPYAHGSLVLEADLDCSPCNFNAVCQHYGCRETITPEMVFRLAMVLAGRDNMDTLRPEDFRGVRLHRASFNDVGRLEFLPVFRYPLSLYQFLGFFYADTWEFFYGLRSKPRLANEILDDIQRLHDLENSWESLREALRRGMRDFVRIEQELRAGKMFLRPLLSGNPDAISQQRWRQGLDEFQAVYQRVVFFGSTHPGVRHFTSLLELAVESQAGQAPAVAVRKIHESVCSVLQQVAFLRNQLQQARSRLDEEYLPLVAG